MRRLVRLASEAVRMGLSQPATTAVTAVIVAAVCGVIVSTTGQTVAAEREVLSRIDEAGTRTVVVEDTQGRAGFDPDVVERIAALDGVSWAVGFGPASDVRPAGVAGAQPVAIRTLHGVLPDVVEASPWDQRVGTALAGVEALAALGFETAAGPVRPSGDGPDVGVVGWLRADAPLEFMNRALVRDPSGGDDQVIRVFALVESPQRVPTVAAAIGSVLDPDDPSSVAVQTSEALVAVRAAVQGELGTYGRNLITLVLAAGLVLTALNVYGAVTTRRRDFGRRRALGASRPDIVTLITTQTTLTAIVGAALGTIVGAITVERILGTTPDVAFLVAIAVLAVIATTAAAVPPAVVAAFRDPVTILRVP